MPDRSGIKPGLTVGWRFIRHRVTAGYLPAIALAQARQAGKTRPYNPLSVWFEVARINNLSVVP